MSMLKYNQWSIAASHDRLLHLSMLEKRRPASNRTFNRRRRYVCAALSDDINQLAKMLIRFRFGSAEVKHSVHAISLHWVLPCPLWSFAETLDFRRVMKSSFVSSDRLTRLTHQTWLEKKRKHLLNQQNRADQFDCLALCDDRRAPVSIVGRRSDLFRLWFDWRLFSNEKSLGTRN